MVFMFVVFFMLTFLVLHGVIHVIKKAVIYYIKKNEDL